MAGIRKALSRLQQQIALLASRQFLPRADSLPAGTADRANTKTEARALTIDAAQKICGEHGVTLDWFYRADRSMLPHHLAIEIARIEAAEQEF